VDAIEWARAHGATGQPELEKDRPSARTTRVGELWLKECRAVQAYEPRLTAKLYERWPDRVTDDDLHLGNVSGVRILDWGDASISHPFLSLVVLFWNGELTEGLRDAYLEPWGDAAADLEIALRLGSVAHLFKWMRIREAMSPDERMSFDAWFPRVLEKVVEHL
jgi:hypothetical protein